MQRSTRQFDLRRLALGMGPSVHKVVCDACKNMYPTGRHTQTSEPAGGGRSSSMVNNAGRKFRVEHIFLFSRSVHDVVFADKF